MEQQKNKYGLVGPEPTEEEIKRDAYKKLPPRIYLIYNFLKEHCVGFKNAMHGRVIISNLRMLYPDIFNSNYSNLKADIKIIRNNFPRKIGSTSNHGYWLMTSEDVIDGQHYAIQNVFSALKTLVASGVKKEVFYNFLNGLKNNVVADEQVRLQITSGIDKIIHTLSDDLK